MDPTALPTDNLYKFLALAGLMLAGFCGWLTWRMRESHFAAIAGLRAKLAALRAKNKSVKLQLDAAKRDAVDARARLGGTQTKLEEVKAMEPRVAMTELPPLVAAVEQLLSVMAALEARQDERESEQNAIDLEASLCELSLANHEKWVRRFSPLQRALRASVVIGIGVSCAGFYFWYVNAQWYTDKQTKADFEDHMAELAVKRAARAKVKP